MTDFDKDCQNLLAHALDGAIAFSL